MKKLFLLCNAHLDPVWLWKWDEGAAEAISTFRVAADFCEQYEGFVFNHNEVVLYKWVQEYEPGLFERIQKLVKEGKWHIMGGWYLQPDCIMPSGESLSRQILAGRQYFKKYFGKVPTTAISFDCFGHSRGLVQILKKSGYDSYVFQRPNPIKHGDFIWKGYDGSEITTHRMYGAYLTQRGVTTTKIGNLLKDFPEKEMDMLLWGIGNHGGGPSHEDMKLLKDYMKTVDFEIKHSTPEEYFKELKTNNLPVVASSLTPSMPLCYLSMVRIKQKHRELENLLYLTEKMASAAALNGLMEYPKDEIEKAQEDLLFNEFHDILPGSCIKPAEEDALALFGHGIETLNRIKTKALFSLCNGQERAEEKTIPIMVYNPHPYKVKTMVECEFQMQDQNYNNYDLTLGEVYSGNTKVKSQFEKEECSLNLDWRKKVVFEAELRPSSVNRFDCRLKKYTNEKLSRLEEFGSPIYFQEGNPYLKETEKSFIFNNRNMEAVISKKTGLVDVYKVNGKDILKKGAFLPLVIDSNVDPWGMKSDTYKKVLGKFKLLSPKQGSKVSGIRDNKIIPSVRVIENGAARAVIQAVLGYDGSYATVEYKLNTSTNEIDYSIKLIWNHPGKMVKLSLPTEIKRGKYFGQTAFGKETFTKKGIEEVFQKYVALESRTASIAVINNGIHSGSINKNELRINLLHSPGYSVHPIHDKTYMPKDRAMDFIDIGERSFEIKVMGYSGDCHSNLEMDALVYNEKPVVLSYFPSGSGEKPKELIKISDNLVILSAFKQAEDESGYIIRIFESQGKAKTTEVTVPAMGISQKIRLKAFEIVTLKAVKGKKQFERCMITEEAL